MATRTRLQRPVDIAGLAAFRIGFGALLLVAALRYFAHGWIAEYFLIPRHFFKYWGLDWIRPWPGNGMYAHFGLMALCGLGVMLGYRYRLSIIGYGLLFAYAHLIDKTNYLNHYYLVVCVCGLMACMPLADGWSLDAHRAPRVGRASVPSWMLWALRAQFGLVYVFGGVAKLNGDWLLRAQPLSFWLERNGDLPLLGSLLTLPATAFVMSWAGALFDLSVVPLLLWRRTRAFAFVSLVGFHLLTARLFAIGLFPYFMICGASLFFSPDWPRMLLARLGIATRPGGENSEARRDTGAHEGAGVGLLALYFAVQLLVPLRHWLYPGDMRWSEQGFRYSWNVMLMEKNGAVDFRVLEPSTGRQFLVSPRDYFTAYQTAMMAPQPDMVLEAARVIAADFRTRGVVEPAVYADAFASLNGRPMQRLLDPRVDLAHEVDGLANKSWILPMTSLSEARVASNTLSAR
jgi:vitamin K-dependent gamma-carboxylase-like protein